MKKKVIIKFNRKGDKFTRSRQESMNIGVSLRSLGKLSAFAVKPYNLVD
jgi:hypothetical protein